MNDADLHSPPLGGLDTLLPPLGELDTLGSAGNLVTTPAQLFAQGASVGRYVILQKLGAAAGFGRQL
jgi:hypothetical protein